MSGARVALAALLAAAGLLRADAAASADGGVLEVGPFASSGGALPPDWEPLVFPKIPMHTRYSIVRDGDAWVVRAESEAAASGLRRRLRVDLAEYPILRWRWKVENVLEKGNVREKSGDDYPARLYITFEYVPESVGFGRRVRYLAARAVLGDLPIGAITYIWASREPIGSVVDSAYAGDFVRMIVVESGEARVGEWRDAERNVYDDYKRAFGEEPPPVNGIAIMTDTDNTGESAVAWYGDISFHAGSRTAARDQRPD